MQPPTDRHSRAAMLLLALNIGVWLAQLAAGVSPLHPPSPTLIAWGGNLPLLTLTGEPWRLASALFLHDGALHLGLNMLALWITADRTCDEYGSARMVVIYLAGGVLASVASVLWAEHRAALATPAALLTVSVGASGAIMALFGALLVALVLTPPRFMALPPADRPGVDRGLVGVVAANLALGFAVPHVDQAAHLGGLAAGLAIGTLMAAVPAATGARAALARHAAAAVLVAASVGALLHGAPHDRLVALRTAWAARLAQDPAP